METMVDVAYVRSAMLEQLATDFNTTPAELTAGRNVFSLKRHDPAKRAYENGDAALQALCISGIVALNVESDALLDALRAAYAQGDGAWFLEIDGLRRLDALLAPFGHRAASYHQYYVPGARLPDVRADFAVAWHEGDALARFAGDPRFDEALGGNPVWPDMIAVTAQSGDAILGMAAASRDSARLWQIGINVDAAARGRGVATALVTLLARELLSRGIVPFYGTAASHIISQRVAVSAGFVPAWAEMYTEKLG